MAFKEEANVFSGVSHLEWFAKCLLVLRSQRGDLSGQTLPAVVSLICLVSTWFLLGHQLHQAEAKHPPWGLLCLAMLLHLLTVCFSRALTA